MLENLDKTKLTILIADDHSIQLAGLVQEFEKNGYNNVLKATNGEEALQLILNEQPVIAVLDIDMPGLTGFDVIKNAKKYHSKTKFIILTYHRDNEYVGLAKSLDVDGYLLKEDTFVEIENCINAVLLGKNYYSTSFGNQLLNEMNKQHQKLSDLTPSEITILKLIAQEMESTVIAEKLFVSKRTIEKHRSNMILKLGIPSGKNALMKWALSYKKSISEM